jgi:hypothetical protein
VAFSEAHDDCRGATASPKSQSSVGCSSCSSFRRSLGSSNRPPRKLTASDIKRYLLIQYMPAFSFSASLNLLAHCGSFKGVPICQWDEISPVLGNVPIHRRELHLIIRKLEPGDLEHPFATLPTSIVRRVGKYRPHYTGPLTKEYRAESFRLLHSGH